MVAPMPKSGNFGYRLGAAHREPGDFLSAEPTRFRPQVSWVRLMGKRETARAENQTQVDGRLDLDTVPEPPPTLAAHG